MWRFICKTLMRLFQLICLLAILIGITHVTPLIAAIQDTMKGVMSIPNLCWKILPVTGPLILAFCFIALTEFILRKMKPHSHDASKPWMENPMWAAKHIRLNNRGLFWTIMFSFIFYVGVIVPLSIGTEKTPFFVFCGVFGLVLLLMTRAFWLNRKWNTAELRMADVPGVIGGPFSGVAILQQAFPVGTAFDVCLKCEVTQTVRTRSRSSDGDTSQGSESKTETVWSSTIAIDKPLPPDSPNRTLIPFSFAIPYDSQPTSLWSDQSTKNVMWRLVVKERNKVGFGGSVFTVPVFVTPDSRPDFELDAEIVAAFELEVNVESVLSRVGLKREVMTGGGQRLTFDGWNPKEAFSMALVSLIFLALVVACFWYISPFYGAAFAALFPGVFFLAILYALLDMSLWRSSIDFNRSGASFESGWNGFRKSLNVSLPDRPVFLAEFDARKENGEWFRVDVCQQGDPSSGHSSSDNTLTMVRKLDGRAEAQAIAGWLSEQMAPSE